MIRLYIVLVLFLATALPGVAQSISLVAPAGGSVWEGKSLQVIQWTSSGVSNVIVEYSSNNGATWTTLTGYYPAADGFFNWFTPSSPSTQGMIRVSDAFNGTITATSSTFTISAPATKIISNKKYNGGGYDGYSMVNNDSSSFSYLLPAGGEIWSGNSTQKIFWQSNNISNVKIEFSSDNGKTWSTIIPNVTSYPNYNYWQVPSISSTNCKIRISDLQDPTRYIQTAGTFTIMPPKLTVLSPSGGEQIYSGGAISVNWLSSGVNNVKIQYSTDNGTTWVTDKASYPSSQAIYNCKPILIYGRVIFRVLDAANATVGDTSGAISVVNIQMPDNNKYHGGSYDGYSASENNVTILSPNGNEVWIPGSVQKISWIIRNGTSPDIVKLEYSTDNGASWLSIVNLYSTSSGYYPWTVLNTPSNQCRIRLTNLNTGEMDISDNPFIIGSSVVTTPSNPSNLTVALASATTVDLNWADNSMNETGFYVERSTNGINWIMMTVNANQTTYSDAGLQPNTTYYYRVYAFQGGSVSAHSNIAQIQTLATGVIGVSAENWITIAPNPSSGSFSIQAARSNSINWIKIYDLWGAVVYSSDGPLLPGARLFLNLEYQAEGVYMVEGETENHFFSEKLIIGHK